MPSGHNKNNAHIGYKKRLGGSNKYYWKATLGEMYYEVYDNARGMTNLERITNHAVVSLLSPSVKRRLKRRERRRKRRNCKRICSYASTDIKPAKCGGINWML